VSVIWCDQKFVHCSLFSSSSSSSSENTHIVLVGRAKVEINFEQIMTTQIPLRLCVKKLAVLSDCCVLLCFSHQLMIYYSHTPYAIHYPLHSPLPIKNSLSSSHTSYGQANRDSRYGTDVHRRIESNEKQRV
jgi:hypothetical protein